MSVAWPLEFSRRAASTCQRIRFRVPDPQYCNCNSYLHATLKFLFDNRLKSHCCECNDNETDHCNDNCAVGLRREFFYLSV